MTDQHPIVFSDKQLQHWIDKITYPHNEGVGPSIQDRELATLAYRAGADAELEACCEWLRTAQELEAGCEWLRTAIDGSDEITADFMYEARRPKPPSLKEQALESLHHLEAGCEPNIDLLRRALEALPND